MKKLFSILVCLCMLAGCGSTDSDMDPIIALRQALQTGKSSFLLDITADHEQTLTEFSLSCLSDINGDVSFAVSEPQSICGISGRITEKGGELTFDDQVLAISPVADQDISPVMVPWLLIKALRGGHLDSVSTEDDGIRLQILDTYEDQVFSLHIWIDGNNTPYFADFIVNERRVLSCRIREFSIL